MSRSALIAGAGVSGPTLAYWLAKGGWDVTVIERAPDLRLGGQNIDLSDAARDVVGLMGIREEIEASHTGEKGLRFVDEDGNSVGDYPVAAAGSLTREIEILRGDLVRILVDSNPDGVEYSFGRTIEDMTDDGTGVDVTFDDGSTGRWDVVIAADGMNSRTRELVVGDDKVRDYLGCWSSYFTLPRLDRDDDWWRWYTNDKGIVAFLRPDNQGTMRSSVNFLSDDDHPPQMSLADKVGILQDRLRGGGWECDRIADALPEVDDIYLGPLHQIKADTWWNGRRVLAGDSAHCPTPYTGMGTTLAVIGAYVLGNEMVANDDPADAFAAYQEKFGAFARKSQKLPPGVPGAAYAQSRFKVKLLRTATATGASAPIQKFAALFGGGGKDENTYDLPRYAHLF